ncbi:MAG: hypothetical protein KAS23_04855 [Anaerohalosphaera sp.]|nr:hypothetical protein [Anaerohalosphaera sp.]
MVEKSKLSKRQTAVIDDLLVGELDETKILEKHKLSPGAYRKWLNDGNFTDELNFRMKNARLKSRLIIARFAQVAAMKLVELTDSDKEETARKACLDIISLPIEASMETDKSQSGEDQQQCSRITPALASTLLTALAQTDNNITGG